MRQKRRKPQQETTVHKTWRGMNSHASIHLMPVGCYVRRWSRRKGGNPAMSNTAEIIQFSARPGREEQRVADTDDGFMRVANELTDQLLLADLTARQLKIMLAVMRKTYGFNKSMDRITIPRSLQ